MRKITIDYSFTDLVCVTVIAAVVTAWVASAGGAFSFRMLLACEAMFFLLYAVGSFVAAYSSLSAGLLFDLPLRLLTGYALVNTALLILAVISPLGVLVNFLILCAIVMGALWFAARLRAGPGSAASCFAVGLVAAATTLWCQDSIDPISQQGEVVVFKPWVDSFYHAVHIRMFAASEGVATLEDFRLAGVPARLYHYGVYMLPAVLKAASGVHSYAAFAGALAPLGVFFTGLAAYAFFGSLWGAWSGFTACVALLLLPDGSQQGIDNPFMSYHWLTQISPSATYGLALIAVAWLLVVVGCTRGSPRQVIAGWLLAGVVVAYKLHYVVASALPLLIVPALFFHGRFRVRQRASWIVLASAFYVAALSLGQHVPGVPVIRLDGSGIGEILHLVLSFATPGELRDAVIQRVGRDAPWTWNLCLGGPYVLLAALGVFVPLGAVLAFVLSKRTQVLHVVFPWLLVVNFLVMFFGLALDFESSTPDELSHRPVMLVYFFFVSWVGGALGFVFTGAARFARVARPVVVGLSTLLLAVPAAFGPGVQLMWVMPQISPVRVPASLLRVAEHMRTHGDPSDLFQDSQFDRIYALAALSERRPFVSHTLTHMPFRAETVARRSAAVDRLMSLEQSKLVVATARAYGVRWFVIQRGSKIRWPASLTDDAALKDGTFSLYDFE